jgi:hypothetical protein
MPSVTRRIATMVLGFILNLQSVSSNGPLSSQPLAAKNEVEQYHDQGHREQKVNEPAQGVTAYHPEHPQNEKH